MNVWNSSNLARIIITFEVDIAVIADGNSIKYFCACNGQCIDVVTIQT